MKNCLLTRILFSGIVVLFISSCASVHYFNVDVLKPAKVALPASIQKVVLINHCYTQNHCSVTDFQGNLVISAGPGSGVVTIATAGHVSLDLRMWRAID